MSPRRASEHEEAVARRLAALTASLAAHHEPEPPAPTPAPARSPWPPEAWTADHTRLRATEPWAVTGPLERDLPDAGRGTPDAGAASWEPTALPRPGRHAERRRPLHAWAGVLPASLRGRAALGAQHVAVVAVLACLGLAVTSWWLVRSGTQPMVPVATSTGPAGGALAPSPEPLLTSAAAPRTSAGPGDRAEVVVDVAGKVRRPGIVVLPAGSRVTDALKAAGGARDGVDLTSLNLARPLVDGEQVLVGVAPAPGAPAPADPGGAPSGALVSLNSADQAMLETLPGVGPVTAAAILSWRESHGGFTSVDELLEVDGIGEKTLAALAPLVTL